MPKHHTNHRKKSGSHTKHRRRTMRGGSCAGASGCGVASFGTLDQQMGKLNSDMYAPSNNSTNLWTGKSACGMTGGKKSAKKRHGKKHGGSGLTAIAVPAVLVATNQMYSRKGRKHRKGKSFRRRRSMRGGSVVAASAALDSSMAHATQANLELPFGKAGANVGMEAGVKTMGELNI